MTSPAEKLFDEIDSLMVRLSGLREVRKEKVEALHELDLEIGQVRLLLTAKNDQFTRLTESVAVPPSADSSLPLPNVPGVGGGFQLVAFTDRGKAAPEKLRARLPHTRDL